MKLHLGRREPAAVSGKLRCAAYYLVLFLCVFLPVRSPIADVTTAVVKAVPDVLIVLLLLWYLAERRCLELLPQDLFFLGFLLTAFVSTCLVNHYTVFRYVYQVRSIGVMYILYYVLRDVKLTREQLIRVVQTLQGMAAVLLVFGCRPRRFRGMLRSRFTRRTTMRGYTACSTIRTHSVRFWRLRCF